MVDHQQSRGSSLFDELIVQLPPPHRMQPAFEATEWAAAAQASQIIRHSEVLHRAAGASSAGSFVPRPAAATGATTGGAGGAAAAPQGSYVLLKHDTGLHPMGWHPIPSTLGQAQDHGARLVFAGAPHQAMGPETLLPL